MITATLPRSAAVHRRRRTRGLSTSAGLALALAALLASLSFVTWRQSRALEVMAALDRVRQERALAVAERAELERRIQVLESRGRAVPAARARLGMHTPGASEMVILPGVRP